MSIDTTFLRRCLASLERALEEIKQLDGAEDDIMYDIYRAACVKEFELVLEQSGKLLRKRLAAYLASNRQADRLAFKDLFRHAARHGLMEAPSAERWLVYRDNRNDTAHDYGEDFAETTLKLLPAFMEDAKALADAVDRWGDG
ncbi:MAG: nucleotidyltransferase substrate binding protein [Rhodobacteraceae bacterium]|nr:nucleotidyltransferase substrate binding protein [Paracoccaceae bacterium]